MERINDELIKVEQECNIGRSDTDSEFGKLNFGLLEVVYEWASKKVNIRFIK